MSTILGYLWGGARAADAEPENDNPELAMRADCDKHGDFQRKIDGTLEFDHFLVFRAIITRQAGRMFGPKRLELNEKKLEAFREKNQQRYVNVFREGQVEYQKCIVAITKKACEWIELEAQNYQLTIK